MQQTDALRIVGYIAGLSTGWTDDSIAIYAAELECLDDAETALVAAQTVMRNWKDTRRPPLAMVLDAYRAERNRREQDTNRFGIGKSRTMPVQQGLVIAWNAYADECQRRGRQPNRQMFAGWARRVGA